MLDVFITVDTEIWCDGWNDLDERFPAAFRSYVYGPTPQGDAALPLKLAILAEHGLTASFFVEPLFSARFGRAPLQEVVGLIADAGQEIQLHLHTEWIDEAQSPNLPAVRRKQQYLMYFDANDQERIMRTGLRYLAQAGAGPINAHRAGNFGGNTDTLTAVRRVGLAFDLSYSALFPWPAGKNVPGGPWRQPLARHGVVEYPMTVYEERPGRLRHLQVTACSYAEMERVLWQAVENDYRAVVILTHNTELMNQAKTRRDPLVVNRFERLCRLFARNADTFAVRGFGGLEAKPSDDQGPLLVSGAVRTSMRMMEQVWRRRYG